MFTKALYFMAAMAFALGLGLLLFGMSGSAEVTLFGMTLHPRPAKGVGIIAMIFSAIMFVAVFGSSQLSSSSGR
ncbi:MAG: hypothetical protein ACRERD_22195 [Candidatus Binatia bacterium]